MGVYERLGLRPVVNGSATLTRLGGSIMPPVVREAMMEAAGSFVDVVELQRAVSQRIAALTRNEAAYVSSGAAAALALVTASLITGTDEARADRLPLPDGPGHDVLIHKCQRFTYDHAVRQVGVNLVEFGLGRSTQPWQLEAAYTDRTIAVLYLAGAINEQGALPLPRVIESAHSRGVPVIVDAAAQIPPVESLWRFTRDLGADVTIFSGGKGLCGPQATGLILGKRDVVEGIYVNASPNPRIGRPMKVGKEELVGILAAVEWYLGLDHEALAAQYEETVAYLVRELDGLPGVRASRSFPSEAGQPHPRALVRVDQSVLGFDADRVIQSLRDGEPSIAVARAPDGLFVNPQTLQEGEDRIVARRLREVLSSGA